MNALIELRAAEKHNAEMHPAHSNVTAQTENPLMQLPVLVLVL